MTIRLLALAVLAFATTACTYVTEVQEPAPAPAPAPVVIQPPQPAQPEPVRKTVIIEENTETVIKQGTVVDK